MIDRTRDPYMGRAHPADRPRTAGSRFPKEGDPNSRLYAARKALTDHRHTLLVPAAQSA
jgi:hypothetical protein